LCGVDGHRDLPGDGLGAHQQAGSYVRLTDGKGPVVAGIVASGEQPGPAAKAAGRRHAAGIYGTIITASILAAAGDHLPAQPLSVCILVTLVVYWLAEEYAGILGEQLAGGRLPTWPDIRSALAGTWPMVSSSCLPLLALVVARLAGASPSGAASIGLVVAVVLLTVYAWFAGRAADLHGRQLLVITSVGAALGLLMIILKDVVLVHLH
jgi:hypothetical protein